MDNSHPSSSGKLYFLSMSRNRANEFSDGMLTAVGKQGLVFRICSSGRTLSKELATSIMSISCLMRSYII